MEGGGRTSPIPAVWGEGSYISGGGTMSAEVYLPSLFRGELKAKKIERV